jgi:DNA-directed RNA polymerase specialized sigma24 family protein
MADARENAREDIRRTQAEFESAQKGMERAREARRKSFERAKAAGLSLAEIGEVVDLHRSRVDQILHGK